MVSISILLGVALYLTTTSLDSADAIRRMPGEETRNIAQNQCLFSESNFFISLQAGQPTTISAHHLTYSSNETSSEDITYIVTKQLDPGQGHLLLVNQPGNLVQRFTQADVDSMRLIYIPPGPDIITDDKIFSFWLTVIRNKDNVVLVPQQEFRIQVLPSFQNEHRFRIQNPTILFHMGEKVNISERYFEIVGVNNNNPDLRFVVTEMPVHGILRLLCKGKDPVTLEGGTEFRFLQTIEGVVQYEYGGTEYIAQDSIEVLATDGTFEAVNSINLKLFMDESAPRSNLENIFQFDTDLKVITAEENSGVLRVPVLRTGDLASEAKVQCFTLQVSALSGLDYVSRPLDASKSILTFNPGQSSVDCELRILDDSLYEGEEELELRLGNLRVLSQETFGHNTALIVRIVDLEDVPRVEFERAEISISEPVNPRLGGATSVISVNVVRKGDISREARVRVSTCDATTSAGMDYEPLSHLLVFGPSTVTLPVKITIIHRAYRSHSKFFSLVLSLKEISGTQLGDLSSMTINVYHTGSRETVKVLPSQPVVISLVDHNTRGKQLIKTNPSPAYPLLCLNACDLGHPQYNITSALCQIAGISIANVAYSWEVAPPPTLAKGQVTFRTLTTSTIFTETPDKVLDSSYFSKNFRVRCITVPFKKLENGKKILGLPIKSDSITIGDDNELICPDSGGLKISEDPFLAVLEYIDSASQDEERRNMIHVHLEIPHTDGMIPLVSTLPLINPGLLIFDKLQAIKHVCSNLHMDGAFMLSGFPRPYHPSAQIQGNTTDLLYRHLNLHMCMWVFDAWFHMTQLAEGCRGKIIPSSQVGKEARSHVTVQIPLYVTYMHPSAPLSWTAVEHKTELHVSFTYTSMLLHGGLNIQPNLDAILQVTRVAADDNGCLLVDFVTSTLFYGYFIISHRLLPGVRSEILPPSGVSTNFSLNLLWSEPTWDHPQQSWRIRSVYAVQDYSGEFIVKLIPCIVEGRQFYQKDKVNCLPHGTIILRMPIVFRQSSRPTPLVYNLITHFIITNNPKIFLLNPMKANQVSDYIEFSPGDAVYGRVLWQESQHLHSAYTLEIECVYVCAGTDGFSPVLDPKDEQQTGKPHYGCLDFSPHIKHSFLLLDRKNPSYVDDSFNGVRLEAHFASDLPELQLLDSYPGVDGFVFKVDSLYEINSGYTWYLQVHYTIGASNTGRAKRSAPEELHNGTRMTKLLLHQKAIQHYQIQLISTIGGTVAFLALIIIVVKCRLTENTVPISTGCAPLNSEVQGVKYRTVPTITVWNNIKGEGTPV